MKISVRNGFAPESSLDRVDKIVYSVLKLWGVVLCRRELNGVKAMMLKKLKLLVGLLAISGMMMADVTLDADINLTADADWSGRGTITVPAGIVVNLNGHRLMVDNITGDGRIIDTAATYDLLDGITSTEGGLTFRLEAGSRTSSYRLYAQNDGLWLENCATVIFFR